MIFVHEGIARQAVERPSLPAMIYDDRGVSFELLERAVVSATNWLLGAGARRGLVIGLSLPDPLRQVVMTLASLRIGAIVAPFDYRNDSLDREGLIRQMGVRFILAMPRPDKVDHDLLVPPKFGDLFASVGAQASLQRPLPDDLAVLCHGSGTTGRPKIIPLQYRHLLARCLNISDEFRPATGDKAIVLQSFTTLTYLTRSLQNLYYGACIVESPALRGRMQEFSRPLCQAVDRHGVTHINGTAFHAQLIVDGLQDGEGCRFPRLKTFMVGASTVSQKLREAIQGKISPMLCINYGTNEAGPVSRASPSFLAQHPDSVGLVTPDTDIMICDEDGEAVDHGQPGSIRVRGGSVVEGYYHDEVSTADSFRDGWFDTGDIGYLTADGALYLLGRDDDMMILNGFNIHPAEIEQFMESHPCVSEVAAVGAKSELHGDVPVAFVVRGRDCTEAELLAVCKERLGIKAPRRIFFVKSLPRNASGKVLRRELAQRLHVDRPGLSSGGG